MKDFPNSREEDADTIMRDRSPVLANEESAELRARNGTEKAARQPSLVSWVVPFAVTILSFGGVILLVATRAAPSDTPSPATTVAPISTTTARAAVATTSPRQQTEAPQAVRVVSASGSAQPLGGSTYRVTFTWVLDGARDGDPAVVRFFSGSRQVSEQSGLLSSNTFDPLSGTLTLVTSQECASGGWSAELVSVRNQSPGRESTAKVAGVSCR